jgi:nucleotidyltransferase/DNA polymerase involved in DNA repair
MASRSKTDGGGRLADLRNVGKATLADFRTLGIETVADLAEQDADALHARLSAIAGQRLDPCVRDVFAAAIHQAKTGEQIDWWRFSAARKRGA